PRPDRDRPSGSPRRRCIATGLPPRVDPGEPPERPSASGRVAPDPGWPRSCPEPRAVAGTQPLAGVRGRDPDRPRLHPAPRERPGWCRPGAARQRPAVARRGQRDGSPEALVAAGLGGVEAGFRLLSARLGDGDDEALGSIELIPPGAVPPPAARTRANVALETIPGGAGDPDVAPGVGLFGSAERIDRRPFSAAEGSRTVADVAVESLKARGEPASADRLLG